MPGMADEPVPQDLPPPKPAAESLGWGPVVATLIVANMAMFVVEIATGADPLKPSIQSLLDLGADFAPLTLHDQPWRLFTSMFLHFGVLHLAMNMLCLYQGRVVEKQYGHAGFAAIYLVSGLAGSIASMARSSNVVSAGASGAVFGVFGAFGAFILMRRDRLNPEFVAKTTRSLGTFVGINFAYGVMTPGIDMTAHVGGLIGGFASGVLLLAGKQADAQRIKRAIAGAVGGGAVVAGLLLPLMSRTTDYSDLN